MLFRSGLAVDGNGLGRIGRGESVGRSGVHARVEACITGLRAEVADLLQTLLRLRSGLGIDLGSLGIGLDGLLVTCLGCSRIPNLE